ncbi:MAG: type II secretion system protein GspD, partial [Tepidimonas taiwanensis]|nr:type II secretion system protein GspD [Tepidimonas taiwanensis]
MPSDFRVPPTSTGQRPGTALLRQRLVALTVVSALSLQACATAPQTATAQPAADASTERAFGSATSRMPVAAAHDGEQAPAQGERIVRGTDRVVGPNRAQAVDGPNTALRFEAAPLADVVHAILRELLQVSYVVHPPLNGSVTLSTGQPVSAERALVLLEAALQANGYHLLRDAAGTYHIGKAEQLRAVVPGVAVRDPESGARLPAGQGVLVAPLRYIGAAEMAAILRPFAPDPAIARVDVLRNLLVLIGTRSQLDGWLDLVQAFDVDLLRGMSVGVFPLQHIGARDVEAALRVLTTPGGAGRAAAPAALGGTAPPPAGNSAADAPANTPFPLLGA